MPDTRITVGTTRMRPGIASVVLALGLAGCTGHTELPAAPSQIPAPLAITPLGNVLADATLSGMVYELMSESPRHVAGIEGVAVYCEQCGESTHNWAYTDSNGNYVFPRGVWTEGRPSFPIRIWAGKDGYGDPAGLPKPTPSNPSGPGWREVLVNGDTRFEIELVRR